MEESNLMSDRPTELVDAPVETVDHPLHYRHPSGVECIDVVEHMAFNEGTAMKHLWRAGHKQVNVDGKAVKVDPLEDLRKALWYTQRAIDKLKKERGQ